MVLKVVYIPLVFSGLKLSLMMKDLGEDISDW